MVDGRGGAEAQPRQRSTDAMVLQRLTAERSPVESPGRSAFELSISEECKAQ